MCEAGGSTRISTTNKQKLCMIAVTFAFVFIVQNSEVSKQMRVASVIICLRIWYIEKGHWYFTEVVSLLSTGERISNFKPISP